MGVAGRELDLTVTTLAHGGAGIARADGRVVFVSDAIPGERVIARVTDDSRRSFLRAATVRVLEPSEHRRPHVWPEAGLERDPAERAGGAELGHVELGHQRVLKACVLRESLARMAGLASDVEVEALPGEADGTGWRTRVTLHVDASGRPGPYAARSHRVVAVRDLPLAVPELRALGLLEERFPGVDRVEAIAPSVGAPRIVVGRQEPTVVAEVVGARRFLLDDTGFWQVHRHAAATLTDAVVAAVDPERFDARADNLDLYGGVGLFAAALAERFGPDVHVTSVEGDARATAHARENLAEWPGARAVSGRVERWLAARARELSERDRERARRATVVLDPPRSGAGRVVVEALAALAPASIVYVACDPVAFARDVAFLRAAGYGLARVRAFDLFPHTSHVEAVGAFVPLAAPH